jgi:hypothetical protein
MQKLSIAHIVWFSTARTLPVSAALCVAFACGPAHEERATGSSPAAQTAMTETDPAAAQSEGSPRESKKKERSPIDPAQVGTIRGVVRFEGEPPQRKEMAIGSTAGCEHHPKPPLTEDVIVTDGRVENTFVQIKDGLDGWIMPPAPAEPAKLDQHGCMYRPRVIGVQLGQKLLVRNSDDATHNVHSFATRNDNFNRTQTPGGADVEWIAEKREAMAAFGCDIHPWMKAWVSVCDHPFFAVSAADGAFSISGVPPGEYTLEAAHEKLGKKSKNVTLSAGGTAEIEFVFAAK